MLDRTEGMSNWQMGMCDGAMLHRDLGAFNACTHALRYSLKRILLDKNRLFGAIPDSWSRMAHPYTLVHLDTNYLSCCGIKPLSCIPGCAWIPKLTVKCWAVQESSRHFQSSKGSQRQQQRRACPISCHALEVKLLLPFLRSFFLRSLGCLIAEIMMEFNWQSAAASE
eukprot:1153917-Pelagomonas_calceolata.AAC.6